VVLGVWTQGFALARQAVYHLSHASNPFSSGHFGDRVSLFPRMAWTVIFQFYVIHSNWDDRCALPQ
jgi:hypothetical protein